MPLLASATVLYRTRSQSDPDRSTLNAGIHSLVAGLAACCLSGATAYAGFLDSLAEGSALCGAGAEKLGHQAPAAPFFDTVTLDVGDAGKVAAAAVDAGYNLRQLDGSRVSI